MIKRPRFGQNEVSTQPDDDFFVSNGLWNWTAPAVSLPKQLKEVKNVNVKLMDYYKKTWYC